MDPLLIPLCALSIPIIVVPTAMGIKHARFLREVEHAERMRAMELGRTLPQDEWWTPTRFAAAIGLGIPIASMGIASQAVQHSNGPGVSIWMSACLVALGGLVCGTFLAGRHFATRDTPPYLAQAKPEYDPDAFDVVGRRG